MKKYIIALLIGVVCVIAVGILVVRTLFGAELTKDQAKEIAVQAAGTTIQDVTFIKTEYDYDNGKKTYDVEFYSNGTKYEYTIDADYGQILSSDIEGNNIATPNTTTSTINTTTNTTTAQNATTNTTTNTTNISFDQAKEIALQHAGKTAEEVIFVETKTDHDDGRMVYDVEFYSGTTEYDYEIDMQTGNILSVDADAEFYNPDIATENAAQITLEQAKQIALQQVGVSEADVFFEKAKLDYDDGIQQYEIEFYHGNTEYSFDIDANTGKVYSFEKDRD